MSQDNDENQQILDELLNRPRDPDYFLGDIPDFQTQHDDQAQHQIPYSDFLRFLPSDFSARQDFQDAKENLGSMYMAPGDNTATNAGTVATSNEHVSPVVPTSAAADIGTAGGMVPVIGTANIGLNIRGGYLQNSASQETLPLHYYQQQQQQQQQQQLRQLQNIQQQPAEGGPNSLNGKQQQFNPIESNSGTQFPPLFSHGLSDHDIQGSDAAIHLFDEMLNAGNPVPASTNKESSGGSYNDNNINYGSDNNGSNSNTNAISSGGNTGVGNETYFLASQVNNSGNNNNNNNLLISSNPAIEDPLASGSLNLNLIENFHSAHSVLQGVPEVPTVYSNSLSSSLNSPFTSDLWPSDMGSPGSSSLTSNAFDKFNLMQGNTVSPPVANQLPTLLSGQPPPTFPTAAFPSTVPNPGHTVRQNRLQTLRNINTSCDSPSGTIKRSRKTSPITNSPDSISTKTSKSSVQLSTEEKLRRKRDFHNAVERRRRELIKQRIKELGSLVPPALLCFDSSGKQVKPNKGIILNKVVEYIHFLRNLLEVQDGRLEQLCAKIDGLEKTLGGTGGPDILQKDEENESSGFTETSRA